MAFVKYFLQFFCCISIPLQIVDFFWEICYNKREKFCLVEEIMKLAKKEIWHQLRNILLAVVGTLIVPSSSPREKPSAGSIIFPDIEYFRASIAEQEVSEKQNNIKMTIVNVFFINSPPFVNFLFIYLLY